MVVSFEELNEIQLTQGFVLSLLTQAIRIVFEFQIY
jgi:hypothetical protein